MRALPLLALLCTGCLRQTEFRCMTNEQCNPGGTCQPNGYCSFPSADCLSGQQYDKTAGPIAGECVGESGGGDAGIDAGVDAPPGNCPADYMAITGGTAGHVYKKAPTILNWIGHFDSCRNTSGLRAVLAAPDDAAELTALHTLAGGTFWVGISDRTMESTFIEVETNTVFPSNSSLWATGEPDDPGGGQDCVAATATALTTEDCTGGAANRPAVCECVLP